MYRRTISYSLCKCQYRCPPYGHVQGCLLGGRGLLVQLISNFLAFEAQLPEDKQHMVKQLQANTAAQRAFRLCASGKACRAAPQARRHVTIGNATGLLQYLYQRGDSLATLGPELLPGRTPVQQGGVLEHANVLQPGVRVLGQGGQVAEEVWEGLLDGCCGLVSGASHQAGQDGGGEEGYRVFGARRVCEEREEVLVWVAVLEERFRQGGNT